MTRDRKVAESKKTAVQQTGNRKSSQKESNRIAGLTVIFRRFGDTGGAGRGMFGGGGTIMAGLADLMTGAAAERGGGSGGGPASADASAVAAGLFRAGRGGGLPG